LHFLNFYAIGRVHSKPEYEKYAIYFLREKIAFNIYVPSWMRAEPLKKIELVDQKEQP